MDISLTNEQRVLVTVHPVTARGNPATLFGLNVSIISGEGDLLIQPDGRSFYLISGNNEADTVYQVTGEGDPTPGKDRLGPDTITMHVMSTVQMADRPVDHYIPLHPYVRHGVMGMAVERVEHK
jgi:hypothetical protein